MAEIGDLPLEEGFSPNLTQAFKEFFPDREYVLGVPLSGDEIWRMFKDQLVLLIIFTSDGKFHTALMKEEKAKNNVIIYH